MACTYRAFAHANPRAHALLFSPAHGRETVSDALLPLLSKSYPLPRQAYDARGAACGLLVFLPLVWISLPF